jgi:restriction system protein
VTPTLCSRKKASSRLAGMRWETSPRFTTTARPSRWPSPKHSPRQPGAIPNYAGQLLRFVHEMQVGDLVLYPSKRDRMVHFGRVTGGYIYDSHSSPHYPNRRPVQWLKAVPRTQFNQGALYELGSAMSFFQVRNYADEYRAALVGNAQAEPVNQDETVCSRSRRH